MVFRQKAHSSTYSLLGIIGVMAVTLALMGYTNSPSPAPEIQGYLASETHKEALTCKLIGLPTGYIGNCTERTGTPYYCSTTYSNATSSTCSIAVSGRGLLNWTATAINRTSSYRCNALIRQEGGRYTQQGWMHNTIVDGASETIVFNCTPSLGPICGNEVIDSGEVCDGINLNSNTCMTIGQGFSGGNLKCLPDCKSFTISSCTSVVAYWQCAPKGITNGIELFAYAYSSVPITITKWTTFANNSCISSCANLNDSSTNFSTNACMSTTYKNISFY
jgi:hypothetical protein